MPKKIMLAVAVAATAFGTVKGCERIGEEFHDQLDRKIEQIHGKQLIDEVNQAAESNPAVKARLVELDKAFEGVERASVNLGRAVREHHERRA